MKLRLAHAVLAVLSSLAATAHGADTPPPRRLTISLHAGGKEVASIVVPPSRRTFSLTALKFTEDADGTVHAYGNVHLKMTLDDAVPVMLLGDELTLHSDTLDADEARALDDLKAMGISDQSIRAHPASMTEERAAQQTAIDKANMARLAEIIGRYGWPGARFAGAYGESAWAVLQHADFASQRTYLPMLRTAAARGDVARGELAMLEDRILVKEGKPQLYGTQLTNATPAVPYPIADAAHVDERRHEIGLPPMADYMRMMQAVPQTR